MPRRRLNEPAVLRDACLQNIACHFDSYWCAGKTTVLNPRCLRKCIGSFEYLSDDMIQNLLEVLAEKKLLRRQHFQFLLSSNIRRLNLSVLGRVVQYVSVLQTVGARCRKLTHLNLSRLNFEGDVLCSIIPNLGELVSLNLGFIIVKQNVLKTVAENCPNLLELNIDMYCHDGYPDDAVQEFTNISETLGAPKLKKLGCFANHIDMDTVAALLKSQRSLETFHCGDVIHDVFDILYGKEFKETNEVLPEWIYPLLNLDIAGGYVRTISTLSEHLHVRVELTLRCCPYVTYLCLTNVTDSSFSHVSYLKHLKHFHVSGRAELLIDFSKCIFPIVMKLGNNLMTLSLEFVSEISFIRIGTLCPNLESLRIVLMDDESEQYRVKENTIGGFKHLTDLSITAKTFGSLLSEELLLTMLSNATHMRDLRLYGGNITDDIISKSTQIHGFRYLEKAHFGYCDFISAKTGMMLLHTDSPLTELIIWMCANVSPKDKEQLDQEVSRMKVDVDLY